MRRAHVVAGFGYFQRFCTQSQSAGLCVNGSLEVARESLHHRRVVCPFLAPVVWRLAQHGEMNGIVAALHPPIPM